VAGEQLTPDKTLKQTRKPVMVALELRHLLLDHLRPLFMRVVAVAAVLLAALVGPAVVAMDHRVTRLGIPEQLIQAVVAVVLMTKAVQVRRVAMVVLAW
jgi:hypothetical protein